MPAVEETALLTFPMSESSSKENTVAILTKGLEAMFSDRPFLQGHIIRHSERDEESGLRPGHLRLGMLNGKQALPMVINDMTAPEHPWQHSYETLVEAGMPSSLLEREVVGPPRTIEQSPLKIQVNIVRGGYLIFICSSHVFVDAWGFYVLVDTWARYCQHILDPSTERPTSGDSNTTHPFLKRQRSEVDYEQLKHRPELWEMLGLDWRPKERSCSVLAASLTPPKSVRTCIFSLDPLNLAKLKDEATAKTEDLVNRISTNDALVAFVWRCVLKVRVAGGRKMFSDVDETMNMVAMNARQQASPPMPPSYFGNVVLYAMARLPISLITAPNTPLATVSLALRDSLDTYRSPGLIRDAIDLAAGIPDVRQLGLAFPTWLAENLVTSSISGIPFYDVDFGRVFGERGKADFFRYPKGGFEGLCFVMPRKLNGVIELFLSMEASQMDVLMRDEEFTRYAKFVSE